MQNPGVLRESIQFMRRTATPDGAGNDEQGWENFYVPVRARLRPINGREEILVGKLAGVQPFELLVRFSSNTSQITTEDSAFNIRTGTRYDITAIQNPDERRMWLSMLVKSGDAEQ